jgi:hypothetical protein
MVAHDAKNARAVFNYVVPQYRRPVLVERLKELVNQVAAERGFLLPVEVMCPITCICS